MNTVDWTSFLQPVPVSPDAGQITRATTALRFGDIEHPDYSACPIFHTQFEADTPLLRIDHCGHIFTETALRTWFRNSVRCPLCRHDIRYGNVRSPIGTGNRSRSRSPRERPDSAIDPQSPLAAANAAGSAARDAFPAPAATGNDAGDSESANEQTRAAEEPEGSPDAPSPMASTAVDAFGQLLTQLLLHQSSLVPVPAAGESVTFEQQFGIDPNSGSIFSFNQGPSVHLNDVSGNTYTLDVEERENSGDAWDNAENDVD